MKTMKIDEQAIRKLAELLDETKLSEIEVSEGEQVIRVSRGGFVSSHAAPLGFAMPSDPAIPQLANTNAPSTIAANHPGAIVSPMVGTVYLQPEPGTPSFVKKGDVVNIGDTLLIIEAMKVMNPIKASASGTVTQILAESGQPVEYGDVLMVIE